MKVESLTDKCYSARTSLPICLLDNQECVSALSPLSSNVVVLGHYHVSFSSRHFSKTVLFKLLLLKVQTLESVCVCVYARVLFL